MYRRYIYKFKLLILTQRLFKSLIWVQSTSEISYFCFIKNECIVDTYRIFNFYFFQKYYCLLASNSWDLSTSLHFAQDDVLGASLCIVLWRELFCFIYNNPVSTTIILFFTKKEIIFIISILLYSLSSLYLLLVFFSFRLTL